MSWVRDQDGGAGRRKLDLEGQAQAVSGQGQEAEEGGKEGRRARPCSSVLRQLQGASHSSFLPWVKGRKSFPLWNVPRPLPHAARHRPPTFGLN